MPDENNITFGPSFDTQGIVSWFSGSSTDAGGGISSLFNTLSTWWYIFSIFSFVVSALLLVGIVYAIIRFSELRQVEEEALREAERAFRQAHAAEGENSKWQNVIAHASSDSPTDWRVAIIEADIMLDELLNMLGYKGSSIGEKLKTVRPESFRSIEDAWSAHKIRNAIAHRGSDFVLTKRATQEAVAQYQRVFEEFKFL